VAEDPIVRLAELKLIKNSADLEAEISTKAPGWFVHIYRRLRRNAAEAMASIVFTTNPTYENVEMREWTARIRAFDAFVQEVKNLIAEGMTADQNMTDAERQETLDALNDQGEDGQWAAYELGLTPEPPGAGSA
jgi:hypothetical protein